jgi:ribonuclease HI
MKTTYVLNFDGLCEPRNPGGVGAWGWVLLDADGREVASGHGATPAAEKNTNNRSEYEACGRGLRYVADRLDGDTEFRATFGGLAVRGDSRLAIEQINGTWDCNKEHLARRRDRCRELLGAIREHGDVVVEWVPRAENERADELSRCGYLDLVGTLPPERRKAVASR